MIEQPHQGSMSGSDAKSPLQTYQETVQHLLFTFVSNTTADREQATAALTAAARTAIVEVLESIRNTAWDKSGDGSNLGAAYEKATAAFIASYKPKEDK